jgi:hypothetical protein
LECLSIPDLFHLLHDLVKSYSLAIYGRLRQAQQALQHTQERPATCQASQPDSPVRQRAQALVETSDAEVKRWHYVHSAYRNHLETLSRILHPWHLLDSTRQRSSEVERQLQAEIAALERWLQTMGYLSRRKPWTKSVSSSLACPLWWMFGGRGSGKMCSTKWT